MVGLKVFSGMVLNQSGRPATAGIGRGKNQVSAIEVGRLKIGGFLLDAVGKLPDEFGRHRPHRDGSRRQESGRLPGGYRSPTDDQHLAPGNVQENGIDMRHNLRILISRVRSVALGAATAEFRGTAPRRAVGVRGKSTGA